MGDWLACELVKAIGAALCRLPPDVAVRLGEWLGQVACWCQPKRRRLGVRNVRAAFDGTMTIREARRIVAACYRQMGASVLELLRLPVMDRAYVERYVTIEGRHHVEDASASGRPVMCLTGHYGNWELSSIASALLGYPLVALARSQARFPRLYRLLVSYRESKGCVIVHKGGAMRQLVKAMGQGRWVGIVADQASRQGEFVPFFGRLALFATGPFELARRAQARVLPVFMHRVHGPCHRIVIEPAINFASQNLSIQDGIVRFAEALSRHITEDPGQWLWMHNRWKRTPSRRVLILDDGKAGHLKQSQALAELLHARQPAVSTSVVEVQYRHPIMRMLAVLWSWWMPAGLVGTGALAWLLTPATWQALSRRVADAMVSCGSSLAPVNLLWAAVNRAKSVVIMNPAPLPLDRFHLVIAPRHDGLPVRANVVSVHGALTPSLDDSRLSEARRRLERHPRFRGVVGSPTSSRAVIGVFIGGDSARYRLSVETAAALVEQVKAACERLDGWCLVTGSRRTPADVERLLAERVEPFARCRLLLLAGRDALDGTLEGMLGASDVAVVTGESISMVSEACASGRRVVVMEPMPRRSVAMATKHHRFLRQLAEEGLIKLRPVSEVAQAVEQAVADGPPKRMDDMAGLQDALRRLLC